MLKRNLSWSGLVLLVWCSLVVPRVASLAVDRRGVSWQGECWQSEGWWGGTKACHLLQTKGSSPLVSLRASPSGGETSMLLTWRNLPGIVGVEEAIWVIQLPWICAEKHTVCLSDLLIWWHVFYGCCHDCRNLSSYCSGFWCSCQNNSSVWFVTKYSAFLEATVLWIQYMCTAGIWFPVRVKGSVRTALARHIVVIRWGCPSSSTAAFCYQRWCN